jgi:hypothetical protein
MMNTGPKNKKLQKEKVDGTLIKTKQPDPAN